MGSIGLIKVIYVSNSDTVRAEVKDKKIVGKNGQYKNKNGGGNSRQNRGRRVTER
jgi:hypothetical protein